MQHSVSKEKSLKGGKELISIQYLRGFAAIGVVIYHIILSIHHFDDLHPKYTSSAWASGVDIFFIISGFIMLYITCLQPMGAIEFLRSRLLRISPLYWMATIIMFMMPLISRTIGWSSSMNPIQLLSSLFFVGGVKGVGFVSGFPVYRAGWTINYEIFFYFLFSIGLLLRDLTRTVVFVAVTIGALCLFGAIMPHLGSVQAFYTSDIQFEFVFGLLIASVYVRGVRLPHLLNVTLVLLGLSAIWIGAHEDHRVIYKGVPAAFVVIGLVGLNRVLERAPARLFKLLGDASYSIYLTHLFTVGVLDMLARKAFASSHGAGLKASGLFHVVYLGVGLAASAGVGVAVFWVVERPLHRWSRTLVSRRPSGGPIQREALGAAAAQLEPDHLGLECIRRGEGSLSAGRD